MRRPDSERLALPGARLRAALAWAWPREIVATFFDPALADAQAEWLDAVRRGRRGAALRARLSGYWALARIAAVLVASERGRVLSRAPWRLALPAFGLAAAGLFAIDAAAPARGMALQQLAFLVVAGLAMIAATAAPRRLVAAPPAAPLVLALALVGSTFAFGVTHDGARRWIAAGPLLVTPAELAKPLVLLALAAHAARSARPGGARAWLERLAILAAVATPVALQPDPAGALVVAAMGLAIGWATGGARPRAGLAIAAAVFASIVALGSTHGAAARLVVIGRALREGGLFGGGAGTAITGAEELHTDLVLALIAERFGAAGLAGIVALVGATCAGAVMVARRARSPLARAIGAGVAAMVGAQALVHLAVPGGAPVLSYGGSGLVATFAALGLLLHVAAHEGRRPRSARAGAS